jgi:hypothetical protein
MRNGRLETTWQREVRASAGQSLVSRNPTRRSLFDAAVYRTGDST